MYIYIHTYRSIQIARTMGQAIIMITHHFQTQTDPPSANGTSRPALCGAPIAWTGAVVPR